MLCNFFCRKRFNLPIDLYFPFLPLLFLTTPYHLLPSLTIPHHPSPSLTIPYHPSPSLTSLSHPLPSLTNLSHPSPSLTIPYWRWQWVEYCPADWEVRPVLWLAGYKLLTSGHLLSDLNKHWFISSQIAASDSSWEKRKYLHCLHSCELYFAVEQFCCQPVRLR